MNRYRSFFLTTGCGHVACSENQTKQPDSSDFYKEDQMPDSEETNKPGRSVSFAFSEDGVLVSIGFNRITPNELKIEEEYIKSIKK